jgi:formiminoglutamase
MTSHTDWLTVHRGTAPLIVSLPHTGTVIPDELEPKFVSRPLALRDTDWWIEQLYDFATDLGATVIRTAISRSVIDVNRDPSGASLYPGQNTTGLCPTTTFDGRPLYRPGQEPDEAEVSRRLQAYFVPYHSALKAEIARTREAHPHIVLYDCHSIRSRVPRLFEGELPNFNIGTNGGPTADPAVAALVERHCRVPGFSQVTNGRFRGGWITRDNGDPSRGIHAIQMETACRGYMDESEDDEPAPYDPTRAAPMRTVLEATLAALAAWARAQAPG